MWTRKSEQHGTKSEAEGRRIVKIHEYMYIEIRIGHVLIVYM